MRGVGGGREEARPGGIVGRDSFEKGKEGKGDEDLKGETLATVHEDGEIVGEGELTRGEVVIEGAVGTE